MTAPVKLLARRELDPVLTATVRRLRRNGYEAKQAVSGVGYLAWCGDTERVESNVITSARVSDIRAAQQFGALITLPLAGIYVAAEIDFLSLTPANLAIISTIILVIDVHLFSLSRATFRR